MATKMTQSELGVLDPETYANGNPDTFGLPLDAYKYLREEEPVCLHKFEDPLLLDAVEVVEAALAKDGPINFIDEIAHVMPMQALGDVLGVPEEDRPKFFHWVDQFAAPFDTRITPSFEHVGMAIMGLYEYAPVLHEL